MERDLDRHQVFSRRALIIGVGQAAIFSTLAARLGWLQISQREKYTTLAENNRVNLKILPPARGLIVDRFGVPLALNNQDFHLVIIPEQTKDLGQALKDLQNYIPIEERDVKRVLREAHREAKYASILVRDNLNFDQVAKIEVNLPDLPGVSVESGEIRDYPLLDATAHLIGYVGVVSPEEKEASKDPLFSVPGYRIGKSGVEKAMDDLLRGQAGKTEVEVNVIGREVRVLSKNAAKPGARLALSIDASLQQFVQSRLAQEKSAAAVIMDVHSGAVYALGSAPAFDPNVFSKGISTPLWEELLNDPTRPLSNKAVSGQYPPGSTFKMVTALAGLEKGVITSKSRVFCPGHYDLGKNRFHCWKKTGHGSVDVVHAIAESCDTFFYHFARDIGIDNIAKMARKLGMGEKLGLELSEEKSGLVPDVSWKRKRYGEPWHPGETIVSAIGQGYMLATPLQLATMVSRLVNGGKAVKPWLIDMNDGKMAHPQSWPDLGISPDHMKYILKGMSDVVNSPYGTARAQHITEPGLSMGGKTGTSQVKRITMQERRAGILNSDLPWHLRHHALFVGYGPIENPRYACGVIVEHGESGSGTAAPVAKSIMTEVMKRDPAGVKK